LDGRGGGGIHGKGRERPGKAVAITPFGRSGPEKIVAGISMERDLSKWAQGAERPDQLKGLTLPEKKSSKGWSI